MKLTDKTIPRETVENIHEELRKTKHDINNTFAVLLALAELAERNPVNYERLAKAVLERCPKVVQDLHSVQESLAAALDLAAL